MKKKRLIQEGGYQRCVIDKNLWINFIKYFDLCGILISYGKKGTTRNT